MWWGFAAIIAFALTLPLAGWYDRASGRSGHERETAFGILLVTVTLGCVFVVACTVTQA